MLKIGDKVRVSKQAWISVAGNSRSAPGNSTVQRISSISRENTYILKDIAFWWYEEDLIKIDCKICQNNI